MYYWHSVSKKVPVQLKYGEYKSFTITVYANVVLADDLIETVLIGCKICSIEILQDFTSWFQSCMQIKFLAHDPIERVLIGCKICSI